MLHPDARALALSFAGQVDGVAGGLMTGLHVTGSAVLDDYHSGVSDLDVVAELFRAPSSTELSALAALHEAHPDVEVVYVRAGELSGPVDAVADGPWSNEGRFVTDERSFQLNPVTWQQLRDHPGTVRGTPPTPVVSAAEVTSWCRGNLRTYWLPLLDDTDAKLASRTDDTPAPTSVVVWLATGPARLWHTILTGEIVSKARAGALALERWPDPVAAEVLAARAHPDTPLTTRHARAATTLGRHAALGA